MKGQRARERRKRRERQGKLMLLAVAAFFVTVVGVLTSQIVNRVEIEEKTNCPMHRRYGQVVVLIDHTDRYSDTQARYIEGLADGVKAALSQFDRVTIYHLPGADDFSPVPIFDRCSPGSPEEANPIYENVDRIREEFYKRFGDAFDTAIDLATEEKEGPESPILEVLAGIFYAEALKKNVSSRRLIVISDLLQNSETLSHYGMSSLPEFDRKALSGVRAAMGGSEVEVVYLWRRDFSTEWVDEHLEWWREYVGWSGGKLISVERVR